MQLIDAERYIVNIFWLLCNILLSERQIKSFVLLYFIDNMGPF